MAFLSENQIAITTQSGFESGPPAIFDISRDTRTALSAKTVDAQSLAVSPSNKRLVFIDSRQTRVVLVESSPGGIFSSGIAKERHVRKLKPARRVNSFVAALAFTRFKSNGNADEQEGFLVMDRMCTIQLFSCNP